MTRGCTAPSNESCHLVVRMYDSGRAVQSVVNLRCDGSLQGKSSAVEYFPEAQGRGQTGNVAIALLHETNSSADLGNEKMQGCWFLTCLACQA